MMCRPNLAAHGLGDLAGLQGPGGIFERLHGLAALDPAQLTAGAGGIGAVVGIGHGGKVALFRLAADADGLFHGLLHGRFGSVLRQGHQDVGHLDLLGLAEALLVGFIPLEGGLALTLSGRTRPSGATATYSTSTRG